MHGRSRLATAAKVPDFSSKDIFLPTSQRTRIILSAMINFIKFSEQCLPVVQKVRKKAEDLAQESESLTRDHARLETQLAQLQYGSLTIIFWFNTRLTWLVFFFSQRKAESRRTQS